jgi:hypothetical protein
MKASKLYKVKSPCSLFLFLFFAFCFSFILLKTPQANADTLSFTSYFSSPNGSYDRFWLKPRAQYSTITDCPGILTLFLDSIDKDLYTCDGLNLSKKLGAIWTETSINMAPATGKDGEIYLINFLDRNLRVGIGTTTPEFKLTIKDGGILATGASVNTTLPASADGKGKKFIWYATRAALLAGEVTGSQWDNIAMNDPLNPSDHSNSVTFGLNNYMATRRSVILGGTSNQMNLTGTANTIVEGNVIGGGRSNQLVPKDNNNRTDLASIANGRFNLIGNDYSFIGTGNGNQLYGQYSVIFGGESNFINDWSSDFSVIGGGKGNIANTKNYVLLGGYNNNINEPGNTGSFTTILGGGFNLTEGDNEVIASGHSNNTRTSQTTIIGGVKNQALKAQSTVVSGYNNVIGETDAVIISGANNAIDDQTDSANGAVIVNGNTNKILQKRSLITNGTGNTTGGDYSSIWGGIANETHSNYSAIANGTNNHIGSAAVNVCSDTSLVMANNFIPNGAGNIITLANYTFVGGRNMQVTGPGACLNRVFVWGYNTVVPPAVISNNAFMMRSGFVGIGVTGPDAVDANPAQPVKLRINGSMYVQGSVYLNALPVAGVVNPIEFDPNTPGGGIGKVACTGGVCDLAENFETSEEVEAGDLVIMDKDNSMKLKKSFSPYDKKVVGIVSGSPALIFKGSELKVFPKPYEFKKGTNPPIALAGRVPCKVSLENGPIEEGDLLTSSSIAGHVMKASDLNKSYESVVGKALQPFNGGPHGEKTGTIIVMVTR